MTPSAERLIKQLRERIDRNLRLLADAEEENSFRRLTWRVWADATRQALADVEAAIDAIEAEAAEVPMEV